MEEVAFVACCERALVETRERRIACLIHWIHDPTVVLETENVALYEVSQDLGFSLAMILMSLVILVEDSKIPSLYEIPETGHAVHCLENSFPKPPF